MILPPSYSFPFRFSFTEDWDLFKILITTRNFLQSGTATHRHRANWLIISGVSVAHAQRFRSSLSSACYKCAPSGPERSHLWEALSWVKRTGYNWIMKWEAEGQVAQVCPYCSFHLRPGTSVMYLSKRNFSFKIGSNWYQADNSLLYDCSKIF